MVPNTNITFEELLAAGVHFGHLKSKWNPKMGPYIFDQKNDIHIIDLNKTLHKIVDAAAAIKQIVKSGKKILFVGTKKQAKSIIKNHIVPTGMPCIIERWMGGMLTNFATIRKAIKRIDAIDEAFKTGTADQLSKKEKLFLQREKQKLEKYLGNITTLNRLPSAIFIVDTVHEKIALKEAKKINIPVFAILDTNADPEGIDYVIPANDDAAKSIEIIMKIMAQAVTDGIEERKMLKVEQHLEE